MSLHLQIQIKEKDAGVYKKEIEGESAIRLTDETAASYSHHLTSVSISTIQKELGIVKKTEISKKIGLEHAERLSHKGAVSDSHATNPISIPTIRKELGIVKKEECYQSVNAMWILTGKPVQQI